MEIYVVVMKTIVAMKDGNEEDEGEVIGIEEKKDALRSVMLRRLELMKELREADQAVAKLCGEMADMKIDMEHGFVRVLYDKEFTLYDKSVHDKSLWTASGRLKGKEEWKVIDAEGADPGGKKWLDCRDIVMIMTSGTSCEARVVGKVIRVKRKASDVWVDVDVRLGPDITRMRKNVRKLN